MQPLQAGDPERIGRFRLEGRLGAGGMGRVYLGTAPDGTPAAIKVIRDELAGEPGFRHRFRREVAAASAVAGMFTARVLDADPEAEPPWLATQYVAGPTLADAVRGGGPLAEADQLRLARELAEALSAIHAAGLVHRDLKPANVLLSPTGAKVIDFGIAQAVDSTRLTTVGSILGTPEYMSPEQVVDPDNSGPAADVFAMGATLAFAATGRSPFGTDQPASTLYRIVNLAPDLVGMPAATATVVRACLEKEPGRRPAAAALAAGLRTDRIVTPAGTRIAAVPGALHAGPGPGPAPSAPPGMPPPGALPAGALPAGALPAGALPAGAVPHPRSPLPASFPGAPAGPPFGPPPGSPFGTGGPPHAGPGAHPGAYPNPGSPRRRRTGPVLLTVAAVLVVLVALAAAVAGTRTGTPTPTSAVAAPPSTDATPVGTAAGVPAADLNSPQVRYVDRLCASGKLLSTLGDSATPPRATGDPAVARRDFLASVDRTVATVDAALVDFTALRDEAPTPTIRTQFGLVVDEFTRARSAFTRARAGVAASNPLTVDAYRTGISRFTEGVRSLSLAVPLIQGITLPPDYTAASASAPRCAR